MTRFKRLVFRRTPGFALERRITRLVEIYPPKPIERGHIDLFPAGLLTIGAGYEWDGPSGPTLKTCDTLRASAVHDALYQLISDGLIPMSARAEADRQLRLIMIQDGASRVRAWYYWAAVRIFGRLFM